VDEGSGLLVSKRDTSIDDYSTADTEKTEKRAHWSKNPKLLFAVVALLAIVATIVIVLVVVLVEDDIHEKPSTAIDSRLFHKFSNDPAALCNDGSRADFFIRKTPTNSTSWLIFLEGGDMCYDGQTCGQRNATSPTQMTSTLGRESMEGRGITSADPKISPHFWDSNVVVIHYCSSDMWTGNASADTNIMHLHFIGSRIIFSVVNDLLDDYGLNNATNILLGGVLTASGQGVLRWIDELTVLFADRAPRASVKGLSESPWLLCVEDSYNGSLARHVADELQLGSPVWRSSLLPACLEQTNLTWQCHLTNNTAPLVEADIFYIQNLFDSSQMRGAGIPAPQGADPTDLTPDQREYGIFIADLFREQVVEVQHIFAPSCYAHTLITFNDNWFDIQVENTAATANVSINDAIFNWYSGGAPMQYIDTCNTLDCNPTCLKKFNPPGP